MLKKRVIMNSVTSINLQENIINNIRTWYKSQKIYTQTSLAAELGVTQTSIARWLDGKCLPGVSLWMKLCNIMNINISTFLGIDYFNSLSARETEIIRYYQENLSFKNFIDKYFSDEVFKTTIDSLSTLVK